MRGQFFGRTPSPVALGSILHALKMSLRLYGLTYKLDFSTCVWS